MARIGGLNRKTLQYILTGILVVGILYLVFYGEKEGFQNVVIEKFHKVPASGATAADMEFTLSANEIRQQTGKQLSSITFQRFDRTQNKYVDLPSLQQNAIGSSTVSGTSIRFNVTGGGKTGLLRSDFTQPLTNAQAKLPLPVTSPVFDSGIRITQITANNLNITTTNEKYDANGKNVKIFFTFTNV